MSVLVNDPDFTLYVGDVLEQLREFPDESVHCVVTSPPYWGLRDYGTGSWAGGDPDCDHLDDRFVYGVSAKQASNAASGSKQARDVCGKCGATRTDQQLGLEATPDLFVAAMVDVFREVRRVLRADGTCWVNLGDSYAGGAKGGDERMSDSTTIGRSHGGKGDPILGAASRLVARAPKPAVTTLKPKDLVGIPWRVAFALQADGWYLRSDIVWAKPNPMPESVTDRPTKAHEYVFLLTRSPRYFFDQEAVRETTGNELTWAEWDERRKGWRAPGTNADGILTTNAGDGKPDGGRSHPNGRNVRSVWEIATQPYPEAHFATFPEALPERCIRAGTSERGCCPECGAPWVRDVERERPTTRDARVERLARIQIERGQPSGHGGGTSSTTFGISASKLPAPVTTGWRPSCDHYIGTFQPDPALPPITVGDDNLRPVPCTVLDPFMGSGTVALVARKLGRRSIGIELNPDYAALCARRLQQLSLFAGEPA